MENGLRGPLLIHAGKNADPDPEATSRLLWTMADPEALRQPRAAWQAREAIIGVVHLADVLTDSRSPWAAAGRYHWVFEFPSPIDPAIPCRGRPGLWVPPAAVAENWPGSSDRLPATQVPLVPAAGLAGGDGDARSLVSELNAQAQEKGALRPAAAWQPLGFAPP